MSRRWRRSSGQLCHRRRVRAVDVELKGYATKSLTPGLLPLFLHLNASLQGRAGRGDDERLLRYHVAVGPSFTLPWQAATTVVADIYVDQAVSRHDREHGGLELGARCRLSPRRRTCRCRDRGGRPASRAALFVHAGLGVGFTGTGLRAGEAVSGRRRRLPVCGQLRLFFLGGVILAALDVFQHLHAQVGRVDRVPRRGNHPGVQYRVFDGVVVGKLKLAHNAGVPERVVV